MKNIVFVSELILNILLFAFLRTMNPVPIVNKRNNSIVLVFVAFPQDLSEADLIKGQEYRQKILVTKSQDNGLTWSEPQDITDTTLGMMDPRPHIYASGVPRSFCLKRSPKQRV